VLELIQDP